MTTSHWHDTIARRPIFTVDYWPGTPGTRKDGQKDFSRDIQHFLSYADPVTVRSLQFCFKSDDIAGRKQRGWMHMPDLLNSSDAQLRQWQKSTKRELEPFIKQYRDAGLQLLDLHMLLHVSGWDYSPPWYHDIKDWQECDYDGTPLGEIKPGHAMVCLLHPMCYKIIDRTFEAMSFFNDEPAFLGFHVENEPHLGAWRKLETVGGNPHTRRAFRRFVQDLYPGVAALNRVAGTSYKKWGDVDIAEDNGVIQALAARFRATWIMGIYQPRAVAAAKKHLPNCVAISRLEAGVCLSEYYEGNEAFGVDLTYLKDSKLDVVGWSHIWDAKDKRGQRGLGDFNVAGGLLRGTNKKLGFTEPHVQRYGSGQWCVYRPDELLHHIYRGLHFNFGLFNLHSWDREGAWAFYNEAFGAVYSKHPGTLRMVAQLRSELDRSEPFKTFGKPLQPPLGILVSRSAAHFPGMEGWGYGNFTAQLGLALESPKFTHYEVIEEQSRDVARAIRGCKGLVVSDTCLEPRTRTALARFVRNGGKLLVLGAPATVGPNYAPAKLPAEYPVTTRDGEVVGPTRKPKACKIVGRHPVFQGLTSLKLQRPTPLDNGRYTAANKNVVYISGIPTDLKQQRALLDNFRAWCGLEAPQVFVSQFENATIVQDWDTDNHRLDGSVIKEKTWTGHVPVEGKHLGGYREMREDHVWLAYHRDGNRTILESVACGPKQVKVLRKEKMTERPHIEGLPDTLGFTYWWDGGMHPIIGRFAARKTSHVKAKIVGVDRPQWLVCEVGGKTLAQGRGKTIRFTVRPGKDYYLGVSDPAKFGKLNHASWKDPLLVDHAFE